MTSADLSKHPADVVSMFDRIAREYDLINDVAALGQVRMWRRMMVDAVDPAPGSMVLDLAAGTGTSSAALQDAGAKVVAADFSPGMMHEGKRRGVRVPFVGADAQQLPFRDASFDAAVISFGLRNVQQPQRALGEMARVVKPGGRVVICEFSTPSSPVFGHVYERYLMRALPSIARHASRSTAAYSYLADSILNWPDQRKLAEWMTHQGLTQVEYRDLTAGIVALHRGVVAGNDGS